MLIKKRVKKQSSKALIKASEAVSKNQEKAKQAVKRLHLARDAVAEAKLVLKGDSNSKSLKRCFERAKKAADKAAERVAVTRAKVRTVKAKARAIQVSEMEKQRKQVEKTRRKEDLKKAVEAFVRKWNRKRDKEEAVKAAKRARKSALKMRSLVDKIGRKESHDAADVARNAKSAARRASKKHDKRE